MPGAAARSRRRLFRVVTRRTRERKFICSELVDECFKAAGVNFTRPDNYISPDDIWRNACVSLYERVL